MPEVATFRAKTLNNFTRVIHFNWLAKWNCCLLVVNIIGNQCCTRVLLYAKMLKETENEETKLFCHILIFGGISNRGGGGNLGPPSGYAYDCNFNPICDNKILCAFLLVCPCVHVNATRMVLFCMIMLNM